MGAPTVFRQTYFHGTKGVFNTGDLLVPGYTSNYQEDALDHVYFTATLDAAIWGAELAAGPGAEKIYLVEPTGDIEDDPNLTDKKFSGNPTQSFRSKKAIRVVGEIINWKGHSAEQIKAMRQALTRLSDAGEDKIIN